MASLSTPLFTPTGSGTSTPSMERRPSGSHAPPSRNPVSLRLYKVLSTNFDEESTKEALKTLSDLYSTPPTRYKEPSRVPLIEDDDLPTHEQTSSVESQSTLSNFVELVPGESASRARKNLRRDMENKLAEGSRRFLEALGDVDSKLTGLQGHVAAMRASCDEAETQLARTNEASKMLLERAGHLRDERQEVEDKKTIITLFLDRFTLNAGEIEAITSRDVPVGTKFFDSLDRTERIREDCRVLMAGEDGSSRAGLEIMAVTASYLEQGHDKILRYCSTEFRQMGRESQIEVAPALREAVSRLRRRPELLNEAFASLSESRQATLMSSFITALTRGGPSGYPRPIELHAHDPLRYVGDMLAWVHQAIAAEREYLESLFGIKSDMRMVGSVRKFEKGEEEEWIRELMDSAVGKLCVPLKVRVQQTIKSQESSIVSYKIANLLQFYLITMYRTIGEGALLCKTLKETTDTSYKVFYESIEAHSQALERITLDPEDSSLTPPLAVLDHIHILREIMTVYQSSLVGDEQEDEITAGFNQVLDIMVDPVVTLCIAIAEKKQKVRPRWDGPVYVINCLCYLQSVLLSFEFTLKKREQIQAAIDYRLSLLTREHTVNITSDAGLLPIVETIQQNIKNEPLSRIPATQANSLQRALRQFSLWLSGIEVVHSPRLAQLTVQKLHTEIHQDALARLAKAYSLICDEVKKPQNKYEAASTLLGSERPFGQIHLLQQIFGLDESDDEGSDEGDDESDDDDEATGSEAAS